MGSPILSETINISGIGNNINFIIKGLDLLYRYNDIGLNFRRDGVGGDPHAPFYMRLEQIAGEPIETVSALIGLGNNDIRADICVSWINAALQHVRLEECRAVEPVQAGAALAGLGHDDVRAVGGGSTLLGVGVEEGGTREPFEAATALQTGLRDAVGTVTAQDDIYIV